MKVSWQWLSQILDLSLTKPKKLAESLTAIGLEVKNIEVSDIKDTIFDVEFTPNRSDLLTIVGIAREAAIILSQELHFEFHNMSFLRNKKSSKEIKCDEVLNYSNGLVLLLNNIKIQQSPKWMQNYLKLANIMPINNVVDIKNYIKLKWGQRYIIFDVSEFYFCNENNIIVVKSYTRDSVNSNQDQISYSIPCVTINGVSLTSCDAGSMNVSAHTILIQTMISDGLGWLKKSNTLTDEFIKCSENCDKDILYYAMQEAVFLYKRFCNGDVQDYQNWGLRINSGVHIWVLKNNVARILGPTVCTQRISKILRVLNLNPKEYNLYWLVTIPKYRQSDLQREIDIIEEIARIYGFHYFHDVLPQISVRSRISLRESLKRQMRSFLRNIGLYELVHSSLQKEHGINVYNPLSSDYDCLRSNIITKLIQSLCYNVQQSSDELNGFEIGRVFHPVQKNNSLCEKLHLGIIWSYKDYLRSDWSNVSNSISWFQAKGMVSNLCYSIGLQLSWTKAKLTFSLKQILHDRRTATLYSKQRQVGFFGEVSPRLCYMLGVKKKFYVCELDLDTIACLLGTKEHYQFRLYSRYPCVVRNVSVLVPRDFNIGFMIYKMNSIKNSCIKSIEVLGEYLGNKIPSGKRSVNLRVKYQSQDKTLTNAQIVRLDNYIKGVIRNRLNIEVL